MCKVTPTAIMIVIRASTVTAPTTLLINATELILLIVLVIAGDTLAADLLGDSK